MTDSAQRPSIERTIECDDYRNTLILISLSRLGGAPVYDDATMFRMANEVLDRYGAPRAAQSTSAPATSASAPSTAATNLLIERKVERLASIALSCQGTYGKRDANGLTGYSRERYEEAVALRNEILAALSSAPATGATPLTRSAAALPFNIRKELEGSGLHIEKATAIADLCEGRLSSNALLDLHISGILDSSLDAEDAARLKRAQQHAEEVLDHVEAAPKAGPLKRDLNDNESLLAWAVDYLTDALVGAQGVAKGALSATLPPAEREALIFFVGVAFSEGFFDDDDKTKELVRAWLLDKANGIRDDITVEDVVKSLIGRVDGTGAKT